MILKYLASQTLSVTRVKNNGSSVKRGTLVVAMSFAKGHTIGKQTGYHIKCMLLRKPWPTEVQETPKHLNHLFLLIKVNTLLMVLINTPINPPSVMVLLCI